MEQFITRECLPFVPSNELEAMLQEYAIKILENFSQDFQNRQNLKDIFFRLFGLDVNTRENVDIIDTIISLKNIDYGKIIDCIFSNQHNIDVLKDIYGYLRTTYIDDDEAFKNIVEFVINGLSLDDDYEKDAVETIYSYNESDKINMILDAMVKTIIDLNHTLLLDSRFDEFKEQFKENLIDIIINKYKEDIGVFDDSNNMQLDDNREQRIQNADQRALEIQEINQFLAPDLQYDLQHELENKQEEKEEKEDTMQENMIRQAMIPESSPFLPNLLDLRFAREQTSSPWVSDATIRRRQRWYRRPNISAYIMRPLNIEQNNNEERKQNDNRISPRNSRTRLLPY